MIHGGDERGCQQGRDWGSGQRRGDKNSRRTNGGSGGGRGGREGGRRIEDLAVKDAGALTLADGDQRRPTERRKMARRILVEDVLGLGMPIVDGARQGRGYT